MWEQILARIAAGGNGRPQMGATNNQQIGFNNLPNANPWATQDPFGLNFQSQKANQTQYTEPQDKEDPRGLGIGSFLAAGGVGGKGVPGFQDMSGFASTDRVMGGVGNLQQLSAGAQQQRQAQPYQNAYMARLMGVI